MKIKILQKISQKKKIVVCNELYLSLQFTLQTTDCCSHSKILQIYTEGIKISLDPENLANDDNAFCFKIFSPGYNTRKTGTAS